MTEAPQRASLPPALKSEEAAALAKRHGLRTLGERPPLRRYLRDLWQRRAFVWTLASGQAYARNEGNHLGQLWAVLNPAFLIGSYYVIFGLILGTRGDIENYIGFLAIGVILFSMTSSVTVGGAKAITSNINLVRALHFPRAILPASVTLREFLTNIPAFGLLVVVMLLTGERPHWEWLLFPVAVVLQATFLFGLALIGAWLVNASRDLGNLIPVVVRLLRYVSGVFFPAAFYGARIGDPWEVILVNQPFALSLDLGRQALLGGSTHAIQPAQWLAMLGWAIVTVVVGMLLFWRDEARYGRG